MARDVTVNFSFARAAKRSFRIMGEYIDSIARIEVDEMRGGFVSGTDVRGKKYTPSIVNQRPIRLFKKGTMQRGVHVSTFTKKTPGTQTATITSGARSKAYAEVHNEGIGVMPKRQFFIVKKLTKGGARRRAVRLKIAEKKFENIK